MASTRKRSRGSGGCSSFVSQNAPDISPQFKSSDRHHRIHNYVLNFYETAQNGKVDLKTKFINGLNYPVFRDLLPSVVEMYNLRNTMKPAERLTDDRMTEVFLSEFFDELESRQL